MPNERLKRLLAFLEQDPGNLQLRKDAIRLAHDAGSWDVASELIETGLDLQPLDPSLHALAGFSWLQARRYADAERELWAALSLGVEPAEVRYNLALALYLQGRYEDALEQLSAPLIPFELPIVLPLRVRCLHQLHRLDEAIVDCEAYLARVGDDAEAQGLLALALYDRGMPDRARAHAETSIKERPTLLEAMLVLASLQLDAGAFTDARASFTELLHHHPSCARARLSMALIELNDMHLGNARTEVETAARLTPDHIGTWHVLAWTALLQDDVPAAAKGFESAMAIDRNFGESHGGVAVIAAIEGRTDEAKESIKRALRLDPKSLSARYAQMVLLQREGRHQEAQGILDAVLDGKDFNYRNALARQLQRLGRPPQAERPPAVRH